MSRRTSRPRLARRQAASRPHRVVARGAVVLGLLGLLAYLAVSAYNGIPFKPYKTLYVTTPDVGDLDLHDAVRIDGIQVGQVENLSITNHGEARLQLQLGPSTERLPLGTTVQVRAFGLLGARYIQLTLGHSKQYLPNGATIDGTPTSFTFGLPEALDEFDAPTRAGLGELSNNLGLGLLNNGAPLNDAVHRTTDAQLPFQALTNSLLSQPGALRAFVPSSDSAMTALDSARIDLVDTFTPATDALRPLVDHERQLQATLVAAPPALLAADSGLQHGEQLLSATEDLAGALNSVLPAAPAGLRAASQLLRDGPRTLPAGQALLQAAEPTVPAALKITSQLSPELPQLSKTLSLLVPVNQRVGNYRCDLDNFGAVFRSMLGLRSINGPGGQFRFTLVGILSQALNLKANSNGPPSGIQFDPYAPPCQFTGPQSTVDPLGGGLPALASGAQ